MRPCFLYILSLIVGTHLVLASRVQRITSNNGIERARISPIPQPTKESNILPIDIRSIKDWKLEDMLLVSDIDGNLHALERNTGSIIWTLPMEDPLVKISTNNTAENSQSNILWFVEPYASGSLYYFTPKFGLNKLPTSIKDLVMESPFSLNGDDKIYTGTRKTSLHSINIRTGRIESSFGDSDQCHLSSMYKSMYKSSIDTEDTIMIGKVTYELSIYSKENSNIVWNVTYSSWGPNNIDNDLIMQNHHSIDDVYFTPFHDKSILAINRDLGTPVWISKLPSLAVNVFDIFSHKQASQIILLPHPLKVLNKLQTQADYNENDDMVFINKTSNNKEWFAMSFENYPTLIKSAPVSEYQLNLYKLENQIPIDIDYLKNFQLLTSPSDLVEKLVNGVHEIFHLRSDSFYQPISKFDKVPDSSVKRITDGMTETLEDKVPNIIESIKFPDELAVIEDNHEIEIEISNSFKEVVPKSNHIINTEIEPLSLTKRILEDLLVILAIVGLLVLFNKGRTIIHNYKKSLEVDGSIEKSKLDNKIDIKDIIVDSERVPNNSKFEKGPEDEDVSTKNVEVSNSDSSSELEHPKDENKMKAKKVKILTPNESLEKDSDEENEKTDSNDSVEENDELQTKKKRKRGNRGGKRGGRRQNKNSISNTTEVSKEENVDFEELITTTSLVKSYSVKLPKKKLQIEKNLVISDKILGYGSHGTIVYQGTFENRPVAVKRMLLDFYDVASHEVRLLQESDDHPNVIRYFCSQSSDSEKFLYIALELCLCSLEDMIEKYKSYPKSLRISPSNSTAVLRQLSSGLNYLHSLKIIHRDIKPQNILVADLTSKKGISNIRLLISDFGLCKKLDIDQSSFRATTQNAASGTSGWRAPELLLDHDLLEISPSSVYSVDSTQDQSPNSNSTGTGKRLTKAIDVFSLGCLFFYILSGGLHPFGDRYLREGNICKGEYDLSILSEKCPDTYVEAKDLISSMINFNPRLRPNTAKILKHPFFWSINTKLEFLLKVSDRFEIEQRDPPSEHLVKLESHSYNVHQGDWHSKLDDEFMQNLGKYRKYNSQKLSDLLRAFRNKYHHFNDMPPSLQSKMSPLPIGFYNYFNSKFPNLLMEIFYLIEENLKEEHIFQDYF